MNEDTIEAYRVVISFQFSTFVSLMQLELINNITKDVVISFQFSTFVSLMQPLITLSVGAKRCD